MMKRAAGLAAPNQVLIALALLLAGCGLSPQQVTTIATSSPGMADRHRGAWPMSRDDTAFSAEYVYGMLRACYEGWTTYLQQGTPLPSYKPYAAGDLWGCLGRWYSGWWYTSGAVSYINKVKAALSQKTWLTSGF